MHTDVATNLIGYSSLLTKVYAMGDCHVLCAVNVLECCVGEPVVVCGGGCVDTSIAHYLRTKVS